ncbi:MAG: hypothetical protein LBE59_00450, partial [Nevskiaceae bacterium]|nr:hypothetical protein [Nevskiaceae bacterium]
MANDKVLHDLTSATFKRLDKAADVLTSAEALAELTPGVTLVPDGLPHKSTGIRFTIVRPEDLLALDIVALGVTRETSQGKPVLRAGGKAGSLVVRLAYQHVGEQATREANGVDLEFAPTPVGARAARRSRVVFIIPAGAEIGYSVEGILDAMARLQMRVVPLAKPYATAVAAAPNPPVLQPLTATFGGAQLFDVAGQLVLDAAASKVSSAPRTTSQLIRDAATLRQTRTRLVSAAAIDLRTPAARAKSEIAARIDAVAAVKPIVTAALNAPRAPKDDETAIEIPFRLSMSPSKLGGWAHANTPVAAPDDPSRVELWHSRLGVRSVAQDGSVTIDERENAQRILRAVWAREMELNPDPHKLQDINESPFLMSLSARNRLTLVGLTTSAPEKGGAPFSTHKLMLSALGGWLDGEAVWPRGTGESLGLPEDLTRWKHIAPMGRDQFVRVDKPGYIYPFGHEAILVKITERKIKDADNPQARLYQRKFIIVSEPVKRYSQRDMPLSEVRIAPLVTPDLDFPTTDPTGVDNEDLFWPRVGGQRFAWKLHALDRDGKPVNLDTPLLFVSTVLADKAVAVDAYKAGNANQIAGRNQQIAFASSLNPGDTSNETVKLKMDGSFSGDVPVPKMIGADVIIPAMRHLTPSSPVTAVKYPQFYVNGGFGGANNAGDIFLELESASGIKFDSSQSSGGFIKPNINVAALSRVAGLAGDVANVQKAQFNPQDFLGDALPKLFGMVDLLDLLNPDFKLLDFAPKFVSEAMDGVSALLRDLAQFKDVVEKVKGEVEAFPANLANEVKAAVKAVEDAVSSLLDTGGDAEEVEDALSDAFDTLRGLVEEVRNTAADNAAVLGPTLRAQVERLTGALLSVLNTVEPLIEQVVAFINGFDPGNLSFRAHLDWRPKIRHWPYSGGDKSKAIFIPGSEDALLLSIDVRGSGAGGGGVDILAELKNFDIQLLPGQPLMGFHFDRLAFRSGSSLKTEIDIVFGGIRFLGFLKFIDGLRSLIPLDGFSDPPFVDVSAEGVTAGFTVALPNL